VKPLVVLEVGPPARNSNQEFRFDPDNVFTKSAPEPNNVSVHTARKAENEADSQSKKEDRTISHDLSRHRILQKCLTRSSLEVRWTCRATALRLRVRSNLPASCGRVERVGALVLAQPPVVHLSGLVGRHRLRIDRPVGAEGLAEGVVGVAGPACLPVASVDGQMSPRMVTWSYSAVATHRGRR
jgi:hypothetical protein